MKLLVIVAIVALGIITPPGSAQLAAPTGVCYPETADAVQVEMFCRSVPDCNEVHGTKDPLQYECYMRCHVHHEMDAPGEPLYDCSLYGKDMKCHEPVTCLLPPVQGMNQGAMNNLIGGIYVPPDEADEDGQ